MQGARGRRRRPRSCRNAAWRRDSCRSSRTTSPSASIRCATCRCASARCRSIPTNALKYNLTWSTDGLINEYCNPCEAIHRRRSCSETLALEGIEEFSLDGIGYEAFNTSGGLGTLCETLSGKVENLNYKTVRYPGHCELDQDADATTCASASGASCSRTCSSTRVPMTLQDVVLIFVTVSGTQNGRLTQETYAKKIYTAKSTAGSCRRSRSPPRPASARWSTCIAKASSRTAASCARRRSSLADFLGQPLRALLRDNARH